MWHLRRRSTLAAPLVLAMLASCVLAPESNEDTPRALRVMTWNIQHGRGTDGEIDLERIAALIAHKQPDLVALQEVDRGVRRTDRRTLDEELAELTGMHHVFGKASEWQGGDFGNAILSRAELLWTENEPLYQDEDVEERAALVARVEHDGATIVFISTHFAVRAPDRLGQAADLLRLESEQRDEIVLVGLDLNEEPGAPAYNEVMSAFTDPWREVGSGSGLTWPAHAPREQLDYILKSNGSSARLLALRSWVPSTLASDHRPVVTDFALQ
jgi:endonuclease/exonuclease/phosphatase family metal-dependent hydrolase